jgi:aminocarboxymuconate-semialdehyde decarboxylase
VPLQDPALAARELERLAADGFRGVEIGTNVNGVPIGDPRFEPFFAAAEALGLAVFVHAIHPAGRDRLVGPPLLEQGVAFPGETGLAIASLMTGGTLERHPRLRLAFSHGGGSFALLLPRLTHVWRSVPALRERIARSPAELARTLYYDTLVYDAATLAFLVQTFGASQLVVGTDYPFAIREPDPLGRLAELNAGPDLLAALESGNARRFLGL